MEEVVEVANVGYWRFKLGDLYGNFYWANSSLSGTGSAPAGNGFTAHAIRFRVNNASTVGFVWENASNTALMSLRGSDGFLWNKGAFQVDGGITYTGVLTTTTLTSGAKIGIQGATEGTNARGIFKWETANTDWGIYMSQSGANKSLAGGTALAGGSSSGITSYALRFRCSTGSTEGFIWENRNAVLMSLRASVGELWVKVSPIQYSDRRKKEDIKECLGLDFINKLNPVCYRMIDDKKKCRTGLIAQEVENILTEMDMLDFAGFSKEKIMVPCPKQREEYDHTGVSINPEDVKCVDSGEVGYGIGYTEFIAPLIKAVQQLSEKVVNLEKQNKILMDILQDQTNQLAEIRAEVFTNAT